MESESFMSVIDTVKLLGYLRPILVIVRSCSGKWCCPRASSFTKESTSLIVKYRCLFSQLYQGSLFFILQASKFVYIKNKRYINWAIKTTGTIKGSFISKLQEKWDILIYVIWYRLVHFKCGMVWQGKNKLL